MILVMLEIGSLETLKKIYPQETTHILEEIKKIFGNRRFSSCLEEGNYLLFCFREPEKILTKLNGMLDQLEKLFEYENRIMQGNLVYIDSTPIGDLRTHFERMKKNLILIPSDKGFFYSDSFKSDFKEILGGNQTEKLIGGKSLYGMTVYSKRELLRNVIFFARSIVDKILSAEEIQSILTKNYFNQPVFEQIQFDLKEAFLFPLDPSLFSKSVSIIGYQSIEIRLLFTDFLYKKMQEAIPSDLMLYSRFFIYYGEGESRLPAIFYLIKTACLNYDLEMAKEIESLFFQSDNSKENRSDLYLVGEMIRYYQFLICFDYQEMRPLLDRLMATEIPLNTALAMERNLTIADILFSLYRGDESLEYSKAVMFSIKNDFPSKYFSTGANFLIASGLLMKNRVSEAELYFQFAYENANAINWSAFFLFSLFARFLIYFLRGAFDLMHNEWELIEKRIKDTQLSPLFQIYACFFEARLLFEEGRYDDCEKKLDKLIQYSISSGHNAGVELFKAWKGRAFIFGGKKTKGLSLLESIRPSCEKLVFEAEGAYLVGDYKKAHSLLVGVDDHFDFNSFFLSPYINFFRMGYTNFEDRVIRYEDKFSSFYYYYLGFSVLVDSALGISKNREAYKKCIRNESSLSQDPQARIYCYLLAASAFNLDSHATELDQITFINRAYRHLQEYSGATLESLIRINYLKNNFWNKEIQIMAKKFKLISGYS